MRRGPAVLAGMAAVAVRASAGLVASAGLAVGAASDGPWVATAPRISPG